jgi:hypothetical protein
MAGFKIPKLPTAPRPAQGVIKAPKKVELRPPGLRHHTRLPQGPRQYNQGKIKHEFPGEPPAAFLSGELHGSRSEWPLYAGLWKALGCKPDDAMREVPFVGDPEGKFIYQSWQLGGRSVSGGAVADFEIPGGRRGPSLLIRIQSYRFHLSAGPDIMSYDDIQRENLLGEANVIDAYEQDFIRLTGQELVIYVKRLLGMIQNPDPIRAGQVKRP